MKSVGVAECESHPCSGVLCGKGAECATQLRPRGLMGVCRSFFLHSFFFRRFSRRPSISPMRNALFFFSKIFVIWARSFRTSRHPRIFKDLLNFGIVACQLWEWTNIFFLGELLGIWFVSTTRVTCGSKLSMRFFLKVQRSFAILFVLKAKCFI